MKTNDREMKLITFFGTEPNRMYRPWIRLEERGDLEERENIGRRDIVGSPLEYFKKYIRCFDWFWICSIRPFDYSIVPIWFKAELGKQTCFFASYDQWEKPSQSGVLGDLPFAKLVWKRYLSKDNTKIISVTEGAKTSIEANMGAEVNKVIPHACDTDIFRPVETVEPEQLTVLFAGRLIEKKGVRELISISKNNPEIDFWFCGRGELEKEVVKAAEEQNNIEHFGYIEEKERLVQFYNKADILAVPSKKEGSWSELFGLVIIEAMACETPVVASNHSGPRDIITSETGVVVEEENWEDGIKTLLGKDLDKMGEKARDRVLKNFDVDKVADQWLTVLKS